ncbi:hypothetical protein RBH29_01070 [Herbivorax sp. ANBcel31]|uniref:hypothetical protein n=1 Tax=Herbivorax sp. ANBcel31 TaxID=3069754 RepID=UPI0027B33220|nr:hypothetical protein [Herbivorax sp. ANBcel31]MDQ2085028.1 hypothetical protein [Herbivorax sp. ANBcel31]
MYYIIGLLIYGYVAFCTYAIAIKLNREEDAWMAFVPLLNLYVLVSFADLPIYACIAFLIPVVNYFLIAFCYMRIFAFVGKSPWLGLLMFIPLVNLVVLGYVAFTDEPEQVDFSDL